MPKPKGKPSQEATEDASRKWNVRTLKEYPKEAQRSNVNYIFDRPYDHESHDAYSEDMAVEYIEVLEDETKRMNGRLCRPGDYIKLHFKTFNEDKEKLEDSREYKKKTPTVF